ncbi:MAG TPA: glutathione transferase GstA [Burkholderiaceae bacterium]|nr:glutathione transferase GstA [Burkholderiaceae bacterium]
MKLYFSPGACSLSPHIVLHEAGLAFELEKTDLRSKRTAGGLDYNSINPKGAVPALELDDGQLLTEGPAIVQYLADLVPEKQLAPAAGSMPRYRLMEWLNFISSEIHKSFSPLFNPAMPEEAKKLTIERLISRIDYVETQLQAGPYLLGQQFTVADAYLFTVLRWSGKFDIGLSRWPAIAAWFRKVEQRPAVQAALAAEK